MIELNGRKIWVFNNADGEEYYPDNDELESIYVPGTFAYVLPNNSKIAHVVHLTQDNQRICYPDFLETLGLSKAESLDREVMQLIRKAATCNLQGKDTEAMNKKEQDALNKFALSIVGA